MLPKGSLGPSERDGWPLCLVAWPEQACGPGQAEVRWHPALLTALAAQVPGVVGREGPCHPPFGRQSHVRASGRKQAGRNPAASPHGGGGGALPPSHFLPRASVSPLDPGTSPAFLGRQTDGPPVGEVGCLGRNLQRGSGPEEQPRGPGGQMQGAGAHSRGPSGWGLSAGCRAWDPWAPAPGHHVLPSREGGAGPSGEGLALMTRPWEGSGWDPQAWLPRSTARGLLQETPDPFFQNISASGILISPSFREA